MGNCTSGSIDEQPLKLQASPYKKQGHRIVEDVPDDLFLAVIRAVKEAELKKQAPVYLLEIWKAFEYLGTPPCDLQKLHAILFDLYRDD